MFKKININVRINILASMIGQKTILNNFSLKLCRVYIQISNNAK